MRDNQWKLDMTEGALAASEAGILDRDEFWKLRASIKEPIDEKRMEADTARRIAAGGV